MMHRAFTLVEVVVTLGIAVVMLLALVQFFIGTNAQFAYQKDFVEVAQGADEIAQAVTELALPSSQVLASHAFLSGTRQSATTTLVLEIPAIDSSGVVVPGAYDYAAFYLADGSLYRTLEAHADSARHSATRLMSTQVSDAAFTYDSASFTDVRTVTVSVTTSADGIEHTVTQTVRLRNAPQ